MPENAKPLRKNAKQNLGWDDLELVLALCRAGSLSGAAKQLGVNTSTIGRRLDSLEGALDAHLFDRSTTGLTTTELAAQLMPIAESMERSVADALRLVEGRETEPEGSVRVTAPPGVANWFVAPALVRLRARYPKLDIVLDAEVSYSDLTRREADIALRGHRPRRGDLVATRLLESESVPVAAPARVCALGTIDGLDAIEWINWAEDLASLPDARWLSAHVNPSRIVLQTSSMDAQIQAAIAGLGAMLIARLYVPWVGLEPLDLSAALRERLSPLPRAALWLVGHRALRDVPRVRAVWEFIVAEAALMSRGRSRAAATADPS